MAAEERVPADTVPPSGGARWTFGPAIFDERTLELTLDGQPVTLERKSLEVLRQLLYRAGEVVTKDELLETVWPGRILSESVLAKSVSRIREVLNDDQQTVIKTVHGYGYRFVAAVTVEAARAAAPPRLSLKPGDHPPQRPLWSLVEPLGAGGQGEAWLVRHDKTREQRVCKFALDSAGLTAIKREITLHRYLRDALGDRTDFVRVIDWNLDDPPYFIELEYAKAGNLETWAEAQGGIAAVDLNTRLDIVARIADALAAAHSVGVLHKDLKPTNILVPSPFAREDSSFVSLSPRAAGGEGQGEGRSFIPSPLAGEGQGEGAVRAADRKQPVPIQLTDFGSATLVDATRLDALHITRLGFTKSVLADDAHATPLYLAPEVMAGQPATVHADLYSLGVILYQLVVGDLKRPLATGWELHIEDPLLREDIALTVAGDPARRLGDAAALATRLRTLDARHRERAAQQAEKQRLEQERREATERARIAELAVERLRARRKWVLATLAALIVGFALSLSLYLDSRRARNEAARSAASSAAVADFLSRDLFSVVTERPLKDLTVRELLDAASKTLAQRTELTPEAAAQIHASLGNALFSMEAFAEASEHLGKAQDLYASLGASHAADTVAVAAQNVLADVVLGKDVGSASYATILEQGRSVLGANNLAVLQLQQNIAAANFVKGNWVVAAAEFQDLADAAKQQSTPQGRSLLLRLEQFLGNSLTRVGRFHEAEASLREAASRVGDDESEVLLRLQLRELHGAALMELGRLDEAEAELIQALDRYRDWVPDDSSPRLGSVLFLLGQVNLLQGNLPAATELLQRAAGHFTAMHAGPEAATFLAKAYALSGLLKEAESTIRRALEEDKAWSSHPLYQSARVVLADVLRQQGRLTDAANVLARVDREVLNRIGPDHPIQGELHRVEGLIALAEGRLPEAKSALQDALRIYELRYGPDHAFTLRARVELAPATTGSIPAQRRNSAAEKRS